MPLYPAAALLYYNVKDYGAKGNGAADDTLAISNAITAGAGAIVYLPKGTYNVSTPLTLGTVGTRLVGSGASSIIQPTSGFSGSQILNLTADFIGVTDLKVAYANTSYSANPSATGIQITGAHNVLIQNVVLSFINGWVIQSSGTTSVSNKWMKIDNVFSTLCLQGIHLVGTSVLNNAAHVLTNIICDQVSTGSGANDGIFLEDCYDIELSNIEVNVSAGSGAALHIKGRSSSIHLINFVGGCDTPTSTGPAVLIESGTNGTPSQIELSNSIFESGSVGISVTAGTEINVANCRLASNATHGISLSGGDTTIINGCSFNLNGQTAGASHYDFQYSGFGNVYLTNCSFITPSGSNSGQVAAAINVISGHVQCINNVIFNTAFAGLPQVIRANLGYNPVGVLGPPAVPATTVALTNPYSVDVSVFVTGGTVTIIKVGGTTTGLTSGTFRVPAQQTIAITYSVAPTWVWVGD